MNWMQKFKKRMKFWLYSLKCIKCHLHTIIGGIWIRRYTWKQHMFTHLRERLRETWHVFIIWASKCFCLSQNRWRDSSALHPSWDPEIISPTSNTNSSSHVCQHGTIWRNQRHYRLFTMLSFKYCFFKCRYICILNCLFRNWPFRNWETEYKWTIKSLLLFHEV